MENIAHTSDFQYRMLIEDWVKSHSKNEAFERLDRWVDEVAHVATDEQLEKVFKMWMRGEQNEFGGYKKMIKAELPRFIFKYVERTLFGFYFIENKKETK